MIYTNGEIDRIGEEIRLKPSPLPENTLSKLQEIRISHKESLSGVFNTICSASRRIDKKAIVTYRIKRIESIIGKLFREKEMRLSRMWDIGGCRCILKNDTDIYKLLRLLEKDSKIEIKKINDYISKPQADGYRSLHLFIKHKQTEKVIEVQIRSLTYHNWATLVEITDLLYDTKIKENVININHKKQRDLSNFHLLLSDIRNLNYNKKIEILTFIRKYKYYDRLSTVFSRNYLQVRRQWVSVEESRFEYFLIETKRGEHPKIESFANFLNAEDRYFNAYKENVNANIVLTHLTFPSYANISLAYSNYILTSHTFLYEFFDILEELIFDSLKQNHILKYVKFYHLYNILLIRHIRNLVFEIRDLVPHLNIPKNKNINRREKEWKRDVNKKVTELQSRGSKLTSKYNSLFQSSSLKTNIIKYFTRFSIRYYNWRLKRLINQ